MTHPTTIDNWQDVNSLQEFVAYLRLLAADAGRAESAAQPWPNATIPDFLAAVATLLAAAPAQATGDDPAAETIAEISAPAEWWQLAVLLREAQTERPVALPAIPGESNDAKSVDSVEGLLAYLRWLIEDCRQDGAEAAERARTDQDPDSGRWAHSTLPNWLEAWAGWLEACYLKPHPAMMIQLGAERTPVEPVGWRSIAIQLSGARIYE